MRRNELTSSRRPFQRSTGKIKVSLTLALPIGWKINELAPMRAWLQGSGKGPIANDKLGFVDVDKPAAELSFTVPVSKDGKDELQVFVPYYYCQADGTGLCKGRRSAHEDPRRNQQGRQDRHDQTQSPN